MAAGPEIGTEVFTQPAKEREGEGKKGRKKKKTHTNASYEKNGSDRRLVRREERQTFSPGP